MVMGTIRCAGCETELEVEFIRATTRYECLYCDTCFDVRLLNGQQQVTFLPSSTDPAILCIDFGTSSLRAAYRKTSFDSPAVLNLGDAVHSSLDAASIPSAVFIPTSGACVYFGEQALERGLRGEPSLLFETSPKKWMTQGDPVSLDYPVVPASPLTRKEILAGLVAEAFAAVRRASGLTSQQLMLADWRLSHPVWERQKEAALKTYLDWILKTGALIAGVTDEAINALDLKTQCLEAPQCHKRWQVDPIEPIAAAIELFKNASNAREVCVVVDVGAGTIDLGLFISHTPDDGVFRVTRKLIPLTTPRSLYTAGDAIDEEVLCLIERKAGGAIPLLVKADLERRKRKIKETLFETNSIFEAGVQVTLDELAKAAKMQELARSLRREFEALVAAAANDIVPYCTLSTHQVKQIDVVFAGGGASIGFLRDSLRRRIELTRTVSLPVVISRGRRHKGRVLPASMERLAVALGGTTPKEFWPTTTLSRVITYRGLASIQSTPR